MWLATAVLTGLAAGGTHVVTGPDHMAAVAPLAIDSKRKSWKAGLMWGIGHSMGAWTLAVLAMIFREAIPVDLVSSWSERLVGVVLIGIGIWALRRALRGHLHAHSHAHDGHTHTHAHFHAHAHTPAAPEHRPADSGLSTKHTHSHGALGIGTLHGLAGTSHLLGVLPALALPTRADAAAYLLAFGLGSIIAMTTFASLCGLLATRGAARSHSIYRGFMIATSLFAVVLGVYWIYDSMPGAAAR
ncbi:MAG: hypothetical protein U0638_17660 [Phycisphaerales bacterium]